MNISHVCAINAAVILLLSSMWYLAVFNRCGSKKMPHSGPMWRWLLTFRLWNGVTRARGAHNLEGPSKLWKKRSEDWEETQTLRAGRSKAEPKIFATPQTPFPGARDGQNLISSRWSLLLPTTPVWWGSMHAISSYRGNRPTNPQTHKHTGPITIHCASASPARNVMKYELSLWTYSRTGLTDKRTNR